jgi:hypothetical protein
MHALCLFAGWLPFVPAPCPPGAPLPPVRHGDMVARLEVCLAERGAGPGLGEVTLHVEVEGGPGLQVEGPRLGDAAGAWKAQPSAWRDEARGPRLVKVTAVRLTQVKPGPAPLPSVKVRFREGGGAWQEAEWLDVLKDMRPGPGPAPLPPLPPTWARRWLAPLAWGAGGLVLVLAGGWALSRRRPRPAPPVAPHRRALAELENLDPASAGPGEYHTQVSHVLRRYLAERFGLRAPQQTTAEFLAAVAGVPELPAEARELLRECFARCDLAKFAAARLPPEECQQTAALARAFVEQTAPGEKEERTTEAQRSQRENTTEKAEEK